MTLCLRYKLEPGILALVKPDKGTADGSLGKALQSMGVNDLQCPEDVLGVDWLLVLGVDWLPVLIGAGTDGATVNVGVH